MANRRLNQFNYSFEQDPVNVYLKVSFGSSGAPTIVTAKGVSSITRNSAGNYTIALQDKYPRLLMAEVMPLVTSGVPAAPMSFVSNDSSSTGSITIQMSAASGASGALQAADPASGEVALIQLVLKNSSV